MARQIGKLSPLAAKRVREKGLYPDGGNLYLQVTGSGSKSWLFRYMIHGKAKAMGLGACHAVTLSRARAKALECRGLLSDGIDPLAQRKGDKAKARLEAAHSMSFEDCAKIYIEDHKAGWRNEKHEWQWTNSLELYAYPVFGKLSVQDIDVVLVMKALKPIWKTKTETATRVRARIESVLDWATVREYRKGENPARWRGHLESLLPQPSKIHEIKHYSALPYKEIGTFVAKLKKHPGTAAQALKLVILTATRTSEVLGARWGEFDLKEKLWTIPASRIKMGKEHRIPLSPQAMAILRSQHQAQADKAKIKAEALVFEGQRKGNPLSSMALLMLLRRMKKTGLTVHGFRSSFRDWAAEQTNYAREVAEAALSHAIEDKVEAAYRRSDLFDKRKLMMDEWAVYCQKSKT